MAAHYLTNASTLGHFSFTTLSLTSFILVYPLHIGKNDIDIKRSLAVL